MNRMTITAIAFGLAAGTLALGCKGTDRPTANEIVARNAAARGGLEAWHKIDTMVWTGHIETAHGQTHSLPFELDQKRPNKERLQVFALGQRTLRVFDGVHGWKVRPGQGRPQAEPFSPQELKYAQTGHGIEGPLLASASSGSLVTLEGLDRLEGKEAYHLKVHVAGGEAEDVWVDARTYLELRYDRVAEGPGGAGRRVTLTYGDYRNVDGLQLPFLIETGSGPGETPDKMQLERVVLNAPLDDGAFGNRVVPPQRNARAGAGSFPRLPAWAASAVAARAQRGPERP
jgi:hypothetical protein